MRVPRGFLRRGFNLRKWYTTLKGRMAAETGWAAALFEGAPAIATSRQTWMNTFRARSDSVIAVARILLAIGSLWITWIDATIRPGRSDLVFWFLVIYLLYAIAAAHFVWKAQVHRVRGTFIRHLIDVSSLVILAFLADRVSGPVFMLIPFVQLAATLHWLWRGALWTGFVGVAILIYLALSNTVWPFSSDADAPSRCRSFFSWSRQPFFSRGWVPIKRRCARSCYVWSRGHPPRPTGSNGRRRRRWNMRCRWRVFLVHC